MAYDIGPRIGIEGEAEFRRQLSQINTSVRTLGTEMQAVTSAFVGQERSAQALNAQNEVLGRTVQQLGNRLEIQQRMLAEATAAYGEADERTQRWQQAVNRTSTELNNANAQIEANEEALKNNGETVEATADKHEGAMARIGDAAKAAMAAVGAALAAGTAAIAGLVKESIGAYGEFEQLKGGVETLFGSSADAVMEYANNAYKSAGLSANEYMETVTGFSASLLQSLGGNTAAAAKVADMAITDMADNANKMGSSMESIQNAYQGFAKQNYTMLDNLKLGYGGTKEEMERLLADAEALSGVHYDISSYADIVDAIHVIQTEMGITGTTALEASSTIQGSVAAMGSAWTNLIAGMGDENANMDQLISNLVESVLTMLDNVVPRIGSILEGLGTAIEEMAPIISETLPEVLEKILPSLLETGGELIKGLAAGITESLPVIVDSAVEIMGALTADLVDLLPELMGSAVEIITTLTNDLVEQLPTLIPAAVGMILELIGTLISNLDQLVDPALAIITALATGIINALPVLVSKGPVIIASLIQSIVEKIPMLLETAAELIGTLVAGIANNLPSIIQSADQIISTFVSAIGGLISSLWDVGAQIVGGVWDGIAAKTAWFTEQVTGFFSGIVNGVKNFLGIHSPSRVFAGIGGNMAEGLGEGWKARFDSVKRDVERGLNFDAPAIAANVEMPGLTQGRTQFDISGLLAGMVNGIQTAMTGNDMPQSATIVLQAWDGMTLARWFLPSLRAAMRDDPEPA